MKELQIIGYESTVMIGMACARIMREQPKCPLWPIHDCLVTTEPHGEYVLRVLQEEFGR